MINFNWINNLKKVNIVRFFKLENLEKKMLYIFAAAVFIIANFLISSLSLRIDLSKGQAYTLSPSTKKILDKLDDIVNIKFFVSSDLPTRLLPLKTDVSDLLNEYKKEGKGKIIIKTLDPKKDEKALNEAKELGVPEIQFSQLEKDKYAVTASYFGIVLSFADKKEILPQATDLESLEYNLTAAIYKMTRKENIKIGFIGQEEKFNSQEDQLFTLKKVLQQQFIYDFLNISSKSATKEINSSYKTVLVFDDNQKEYNDHEIQLLKKYLQQKGKAIFFVDGVWVSDNLTTQPAKHNLFSLLSDWGIQINENLVLSTSAELVNFGNGMVQFFTPYPFWVKTNNFNKNSSYFANINQVTYPWISSLSSGKKDGIMIEELIKSSPRSWEQKDNFILNPQNIPAPQINELKEYLITAEAKDNNGGQIVVIPSSRFILEQFLTRSSGNLEFVLNVLNDLASEGALTGIRARAISFYPLPDLPETQKDIFKYLNILLLPLILAAYGGIRLLRRK